MSLRPIRKSEGGMESWAATQLLEEASSNHWDPEVRDETKVERVFVHVVC